MQIKMDGLLHTVYSIFRISGSSRQFTGFGTELDESIVQRIWDRAGKFFPSLRVLSHDIKQYKEIRIGLRPYSKSIPSVSHSSWV